mmetsp:Transcript_96477/g.295128  ORF Transcript_96477/g.295128 Transcript_96477/m.295128 type:complete len:328 (-) Transcript_96477:9-992(-)
MVRAFGVDLPHMLGGRFQHGNLRDPVPLPDLVHAGVHLASVRPAGFGRHVGVELVPPKSDLGPRGRRAGAVHEHVRRGHDGAVHLHRLHCADAVRVLQPPRRLVLHGQRPVDPVLGHGRPHGGGHCRARLGGARAGALRGPHHICDHPVRKDLLGREPGRRTDALGRQVPVLPLPPSCLLLRPRAAHAELGDLPGPGHRQGRPRLPAVPADVRLPLRAHGADGDLAVAAPHGERCRRGGHLHHGPLHYMRGGQLRFYGEGLLHQDSGQRHLRRLVCRGDHRVRGVHRPAHVPQAVVQLLRLPPQARRRRPGPPLEDPVAEEGRGRLY